MAAGDRPAECGPRASWWTAPRRDAKPTKVPWIIQDAFPGYHGVAWYYREFAGPRTPCPGRTLLRFWQVDYKCDVWLNDTPVGSHEGGESVFVFDVTELIKPGEKNRLAVRVLNPTHEPIDGIVLSETPHRNKALPYSSGSAWDQGGIWDSVELLIVPSVRVEDLFVRPDWKTGQIRVQLNLRNAGPAARAGQRSVDGRAGRHGRDARDLEPVAGIAGRRHARRDHVEGREPAPVEPRRSVPLPRDGEGVRRPAGAGESAVGCSRVLRPLRLSRLPVRERRFSAQWQADLPALLAHGQLLPDRLGDAARSRFPPARPHQPEDDAVQCHPVHRRRAQAISARPGRRDRADGLSGVLCRLVPGRLAEDEGALQRVGLSA